MEVFKDIPNYEGLYQVSNLGRVKSLKFVNERILNPTISSSGYFSVPLYKNKISKRIVIHKLVAITFLNHIPNGNKIVIDHINHDRLDNRLDNLRIITNRENSNKKHLKSSSKYVGVNWHKSSKKWESRIFVNGKRKHLGLFTCEIEAGKAYKNALKQIEC